MKTTRLFLASLVFIGLSTKLNAQATSANATNTVTATAYLGSGATSNFDVQFKRNNVPAGKLSTTFTNLGINSLAMPNSVSIGVGAGQFSSGTGFNTYIGQNAGKGVNATFLNSGNYNTFIGNSSGINNRGGNWNTYVGYYTGSNEALGNSNICIGAQAGKSTGGNGNIFIGNDSGSEDGGTGDANIYIGHGAGFT